MNLKCLTRDFAHLLKINTGTGRERPHLGSFAISPHRFWAIPSIIVNLALLDRIEKEILNLMGARYYKWVD